MNKKKLESNLTVDVKIHYQGKVYNFTLGRVLRWLLPLAVVVTKLISHFRDNSP
jgi:hypothetical protein